MMLFSDLSDTDTSLIQALHIVPSVSISERLDCILQVTQTVLKIKTENP